MDSVFRRGRTVLTSGEGKENQLNVCLHDSLLAGCQLVQSVFNESLDEVRKKNDKPHKELVLIL